jgi:hypothetical protein
LDVVENTETSDAADINTPVLLLSVPELIIPAPQGCKACPSLKQQLTFLYEPESLTALSQLQAEQHADRDGNFLHPPSRPHWLLSVTKRYWRFLAREQNGGKAKWLQGKATKYLHVGSSYCVQIEHHFPRIHQQES